MDNLDNKASKLLKLDSVPGGSFASLSGSLAELETIRDFILTYLVEKFI